MNDGKPIRASAFSQTALALLLRLDAVILLLALIPSMMPFGWMQEIHRLLGMGQLPDGPLIGYLTRSLSFLYAMHGAVLFFVSLDVRRFLPVVRLIAVLGIAFGLWMTALDVLVGMPLFWIVAEGPCIFLLGCAELWLAARVQRADAEAGQ
jgi:hypothetical protein